MKERIDLVKLFFTGSRNTVHPVNREFADTEKTARSGWRTTDVLAPGRYVGLPDEEDPGGQQKERANRRILKKSQWRRESEV